MNLGGGDQELMVDQAIAKKVDRPAEHHVQPAPLDGVNVVGKVAALHRAVIDHGKMHEAVVGQQEEIAKRVDQGFRLAGMS